MTAEHESLQQAIIGSLLLWPEEIDAVASLITVEDFHQEKYRNIYEHLLKKDGGDLVTVTHALGGKVNAHELVTWMDAQVTVAFLPRYCKDLKEFANKVRLVETAIGIRKNFHSLSLDEMLEQVDSVVGKMVSNAAHEPTPTSQLMNDAIKRLQHRRENRGQIHGLPYGFIDLDKVTCGMHPGELIIIAGRPSMGKSALAGNIADHVASIGKVPLVFSLEMDEGNWADRLACARGSVDFGNMRTGMLSDVEWPKLTRAIDEIKSFGLLIDDTPAISLREIRSKAKKQKKRGGLDLIVVDYLQLMKTPQADSRALSIGIITRGLKQLARELAVPVILLSQLNRELEKRPDKRPMMSDLRDSGEIEQDADVILFPFRPAVYCPDCKAKRPDHDSLLCQSDAELNIAKQRNGESNVTVNMVWQGRYQRFLPMAMVPDF